MSLKKLRQMIYGARMNRARSSGKVRELWNSRLVYFRQCYRYLANIGNLINEGTRCKTQA
jgi:hypothetical protein